MVATKLQQPVETTTRPQQLVVTATRPPLPVDPPTQLHQRATRATSTNILTTADVI